MDQKENHHRIDYVEIPVINMQVTKKFYGNVFGWNFVDYGPDYASFNDGRLDGGFRKEETVSQGGVLIVLFSNNLEETEKKIIASGGIIVKSIFSFPGGRRFHFKDPSGNELAVWAAPSDE